jgi:hypothetical protein
MSLEMAHKVIVPPKKNYIPQFLKQRDINSYCYALAALVTVLYFTSFVPSAQQAGQAVVPRCLSLIS